MMFISRLKDRRFCAFCKGSRRVYLKKHIDVTNVVGSMIFSVLVSFLIYGALDPRGVALFGLGLILSEMFVHSRWRSSVVCKLCGFDPVLYKKSPDTAAKAVRRFYDENSDNPSFLLSKSPLLEVRRKIREQDRKKRVYQEVHARSSLGQPRVPVIDPRS